jgi:hypothetical protein
MRSPKKTGRAEQRGAEPRGADPQRADPGRADPRQSRPERTRSRKTRSQPADSRSAAPNRRGRGRFAWAPPLWISGVLLVLALAAIILVLVRDVDRRGWFSLVGTEQQGGSVSTLEEIRELSRLETLSYVQRTVFPHDFLQPHLTVTDILRTLASSGTAADEALTQEELTHLRAANLAQSLGLPTRSTDQDFVVVTTILIFGYDLERIAEELEELQVRAEKQRSRDPAPPQPDGLVYTLPPPRLLTVMTENINRENYPFPPVYLDAGGWREVTTFVEDHVVHMTPLEEVHRVAATNGVRVLESILSSETPRIRIRPFFDAVDS